jgi:hypothetical protein
MNDMIRQIKTFFWLCELIIVNLIVQILIRIENYADLSFEFILLFEMHKMLMKIEQI